MNSDYVDPVMIENIIIMLTKFCRTHVFIDNKKNLLQKDFTINIKLIFNHLFSQVNIEYMDHFHYSRI